MNFKIVVYAQTVSSFKQAQEKLIQIGVSVSDVLWCNSTEKTRSLFINENLGYNLLFIDHDCELSSQTLLFLQSLNLNISPDKSYVIAGVYSNSLSSKYLQRAHNFIANTWLEHSYLGQQNFILGGAFLICSQVQLEDHVNEVIWGVEDKLLAEELSRKGFMFTLNPELSIVHKSSNSLKHFIRRAWLHGVNEKYSSHSHKNFSFYFWIQKVGFVNLFFLPPVLLHFCIQRVALIAQRTPQRSK